MAKIFENLFNLKENNTTISKEFIAGITTFLTMAYIIIVNPQILTSGTGMPYGGALAATILVASLSSILMGVFANLPFALAPGMGINAFFTFTVILGFGLTWQQALGAVFISGLVFIFLTIVRIRELIVKSIPAPVRLGVASGIGLFLCFIGLKESGMIVCSPATLVCMGDFSPKLFIFLAGLVFTLILLIKKKKGALLSGIIFSTILAYSAGRLWGDTILIHMPENFFSSPDLSSTFLKMDLSGAFKLSMVSVIFTFLFTDMFDSISTFLGVCQVSDLKDKDGNPKNMNKALMVDAFSTTISGILGTSSGTTYIESASGIEEGGRTGLTSVFTGLLFLPFLFLAPLIAIIPMYATSPALVIVGFYMARAIIEVDMKSYGSGFPAFLALILIPLTYSITQGISWSIVFYILLSFFDRKVERPSPMLYIIGILSLLSLYLT